MANPMQDFLASARTSHAPFDPRRLAADVEALLPGAMRTQDSDADPITPREAYALRLVAELIGALRVDEEALNTPQKFVFGSAEIDVRKREVMLDGRIVPLSPRQYDLLLALAVEDGAPVSRAKLRVAVWKNSIDKRSRAIDQTILELRKKLEVTPARPRYILKAAKLGYRIEGRWIR
jgi:DNA-binding response OmpR family regulator